MARTIGLTGIKSPKAKSLLLMMTAFAAMADMGISNESLEKSQNYNQLSSSDKENYKEILERKREVLKKKPGIKEFNIRGYNILALNEKNAKRKYNLLKERMNG